MLGSRATCRFSAAPVCRWAPRREGNGLTKQLFNRAPLQVIFGCHETGRLTSRIHAGGSADPVDIVLRTVRQIVIDHVSDIGHIDATRRDIRCDENAKRPSLKPF